jgi:malonyl-CoA decarboxylase
VSIFQQLILTLRGTAQGSFIERKLNLREETMSIGELCKRIMQSDGEYSSLLLSERILNAYAELDDEQQLAFFNLLLADYDIDVDQLKRSVDAYALQPSGPNMNQLTSAAEPSRQELLRRLNFGHKATPKLVKMRENLLNAAQKQPELKKMDADFKHLFNSWFNRGFLIMQPIDWQTPAHILEKIIAYEAVHEIKNWRALRQRLEPADRRCYAFFHPSMIDDPLVFVEVALTHKVSSSINEILSDDREVLDPIQAKCAIFYSISNCHEGLAGISFGNFLIKQVATRLQKDLPQLQDFSTISPAPAFSQWLQQQAEHEFLIKKLLQQVEQPLDLTNQNQLICLAAEYYLLEKTAGKKPIDPVARFHLKNGATLHRINPVADLSENGLKQSMGLMVNYHYDLSTVERNHERYVNQHEVICHKQISQLLN